MAIRIVVVLKERSNSARCGAARLVVENTTAQKSAKRLIGRATEKIVKSGASGKLIVVPVNRTSLTSNVL